MKEAKIATASSPLNLVCVTPATAKAQKEEVEEGKNEEQFQFDIGHAIREVEAMSPDERKSLTLRIWGRENIDRCFDTKADIAYEAQGHLSDELDGGGGDRESSPSQQQQSQQQ